VLDGKGRRCSKIPKVDVRFRIGILGIAGLLVNSRTALKRLMAAVDGFNVRVTVGGTCATPGIAWIRLFVLVAHFRTSDIVQEPDGIDKGCSGDSDRKYSRRWVSEEIYPDEEVEYGGTSGHSTRKGGSRS